MPIITAPVGANGTPFSGEVGIGAGHVRNRDTSETSEGVPQQQFARRLAIESATRVEPRRTPLTTGMAKQAIADAYSELTGAPLNESGQAILTAQWAHETGHGASMFNFNFGGIKGVGPSGLTVTQRTSEGFGKNERRISDQFRAYSSAAEGAKDYVQLLLSRYTNAVSAAERGDAAGFVQGLKERGYFTGDPSAYRNSIVAIAQKVSDVPGAISAASDTTLDAMVGPTKHSVNVSGSPVRANSLQEWERPLLPTAFFNHPEQSLGQDSSLQSLLGLSSTSALQMCDEVTRASLRIAVNEREDERNEPNRLKS